MLQSGAGGDAAVGTVGSRTVHARTWRHKSKQQLREKAGSAQPLLQQELWFFSRDTPRRRRMLMGTALSAAQRGFGWGGGRTEGIWAVSSR